MSNNTTPIIRDITMRDVEIGDLVLMPVTSDVITVTGIGEAGGYISLAGIDPEDDGDRKFTAPPSLPVTLLVRPSEW